MNAKTLLISILLTGLFLATIPSATATQPNVILIMTDDQGWGQTGYYNHPVLKTPNIDAMAANGLRFDRFYAAAPVCSPTRASVLTGRTPFRTGVPQHGSPLRSQEKTLAEAFKSIGYATGHFGKWHLNGLRGPGAPILSGDSHGPGGFGFDFWVSTTNYFDIDPLLSRNGIFEQFYGNSSNIIVQEALDFIRNCDERDQPFLVVIWDGSPHSPFRSSEADRSYFPQQDENSRNHYGELVAFDRSLGVLRNALRQTGLAEDTILWYCSDNGGLPNVEPDTVGGLRGRKSTVWEGGIRVPAILEWPGKVPPRVTTYPASTMDIFPTLADIVGIGEAHFTQPVDGRSLKRLFTENPDQRDHPIGFAFQKQRAFIDNDYKLVTTNANQGQFELYNLVFDPDESVNLADLEPERLEQMVARFKEWYKSVEQSIAGKDYPAGRVLPGGPERHFWRDDPRYEPFLDEWSSRPEYEGFLKNRD